MAQVQKIRDDLEGVTFVYVNGQAVSLRAGDRIPAGATVGEHLTASGKPVGGGTDASTASASDDDAASGDAKATDDSKAADADKATAAKK